MNRLTQLMYERRGWTPPDVAVMNMPTHTPVPGVADVADRLVAARDAHSKVVVMPDFDMDGIMSGTLGYAGLSELGFDVELYVPHPDRGYGLAPEDVEEALGLWPDVKVLLTCDVGIGCKAAAEAAAARGVEFVVTDHHEESASSSPEGVASAITDPRRIGVGEAWDAQGIPNICGAAVLHQVLMEVARRTGGQAVDAIERLRVLAGIGTVSDQMRLVHDNRELVRDSVSMLRVCWMNGDPVFTNSIAGHPAYVRVFHGLFTACQVFADAGKIRDVDDIDEGFVGFYLAPAFNSCKRMGGDMSRAFGVFCGLDAAGDMSYLLELNEQRKEAVASGYERMLTSVQPWAPFAYLSDAQPGVLGLLATKRMAETGLPCLVVSQADDGSLHGSGRSPVWFPFLDWSAGKPWFAAGHNPAFGVGAGSEACFELLVTSLEDAVEPIFEVHRAAAAAGEVPEPFDVHVSTLGDGDVGVDLALFADFCSEVERLGPFGNGFETPRVRLTFDSSEATVSTMGSAKQHLRVVLPGGLVAISWNAADRVAAVAAGGLVVMDGKLSMNEYMGHHSVQFIGDVRQAPNAVVDLGTIEIG